MLNVLALLLVCLVGGAIARRSRAFPDGTPRVLSALIVNLSLPALAFRQVHRVPLSGELVAAAALLWVQFLFAILFFSVLRRMAGHSRGTFGALLLTGGLSNTAFVGLPVIELALGKEALGPAVFVDQLGSFMVMSTLAVAAAAALSSKSVSWTGTARWLLTFPPLLALVAALLLRPIPLLPWVDSTLERLGSLLTPLALFSIGFQLELKGIRERLAPLAAGLGFKLVLSPALTWACILLTQAGSVQSVPAQVAILQCAMPPAVTGGILAAEHDCDPPLAAAMLGLGTPLSALTLMLVVALLR